MNDCLGEPVGSLLLAGKCRTARLPAHQLSSLDLLRDLQGIVDFDAEISNGALEFRVAWEKLNCPQLLRPSIDERCGSKSYCMTVGASYGGVALFRLSITTDNWQRLSASAAVPLSLIARTAKR